MAMTEEERRFMETIAQATETLAGLSAETRRLTAEEKDAADAAAKFQTKMDLATGVVGGFTKAFISYNKAIYDGESANKAASASMTDMAEAAKYAGAALALLMPGGVLVKGLVAGLGLLTAKVIESGKLIADQTDSIYKSFRELSQIGATGAQGMQGVFDSLMKVGLGTEKFAEYIRIVNESAQDMSNFGGTVARGRKTFEDTMASLSDAQREQMEIMGLDRTAQAEATMGYIKQQRLLTQGTKQQMDTSSAAVMRYIQETDALTRITGLNRKEQEKAMEEAMRNEAFNATLQQIREEQGDAAAKQVQAALIMAQKAGPETAKQFQDSISGFIGATDDAGKAYLATGGKMQDFAEKLRTGQITDARQTAGEMNKVFQAYGETARQFRGQAQMMNFGKTFGSFSEAVKAGQISADDLAKALDEAVTEEQKKLLQDELTKKAAKMENDAREHQLNLQKTTNLAMSAFIEKNASATENLRKLSEAALKAAEALFGMKKDADAKATQSLEAAKATHAGTTESALAAADRARDLAKDKSATAEQKKQAQEEADRAAAASQQTSREMFEAQYRERNRRRQSRQQPAAAAPAPASSSAGGGGGGGGGGGSSAGGGAAAPAAAAPAPAAAAPAPAPAAAAPAAAAPAAAAPAPAAPAPAAPAPAAAAPAPAKTPAPAAKTPAATKSTAAPSAGGGLMDSSGQPVRDSSGQPVQTGGARPSTPPPAGGKFIPTDPMDIMNFQQSAGLKADGVIGPQTLAAMKKAGYREHDVPGNLKAIVGDLRNMGGTFSDPEYLKALVGNVMKESMGKGVNENMVGYKNTDNDRIRLIFGSRITDAFGPYPKGSTEQDQRQRDAHDAKLNEFKKKEAKQFAYEFTELVYGHNTKLGRDMGNTQPGEGFKYRGRGFIGITGKSNYAAASQYLYKDNSLVEDPEKLNDVKTMVPAVGAYLKAISNPDRMRGTLGIPPGPLSRDNAEILVTSQIAGSDIRKKKKAWVDEILGKVAKFSNQYASTAMAANGGVFSGPTSGYPITMHGTEAVVPLPDGKKIPVSLDIKQDRMAAGGVGATVGGFNPYLGYNMGPMTTDLTVVKQLAATMGAFDKATQTITNPEAWKEIVKSGIATNYEIGMAKIGTEMLPNIGQEMAQRLTDIVAEKGVDQMEAFKQMTSEFKSAMTDALSKLTESQGNGDVKNLLGELVSRQREANDISSKLLSYAQN